MSGLEIVGVVLAAAPIIVAALKRYRATKQIWGWTKHMALHIDDLIEALMENQGLVETSFELLCRAAGIEETSSYNTGAVSLLERLDVEAIKKLQHCMGTLFGAYRYALRRYENTLVAIVAKCDGLPVRPVGHGTCSIC